MKENIRLIADNVERGSKRHLRRELSIGWSLAIIAAELFVIVALIALKT